MYTYNGEREILNNPIADLHKWANGVLAGYPESLMTIIMIALAGALTYGALVLTPAAKAAVIAWVVLP